MLQGHGPFPWSHRESNSDLIFRRDLFYPLNYETPLHAIVYAKMLPTSAKKACFQFAECSYILCKDVANECRESLLSICRVQLYLMQRYNNLKKNKVKKGKNYAFIINSENLTEFRSRVNQQVQKELIF